MTLIIEYSKRDLKFVICSNPWPENPNCTVWWWNTLYLKLASKPRIKIFLLTRMLISFSKCLMMSFPTRGAKGVALSFVSPLLLFFLSLFFSPLFQNVSCRISLLDLWKELPSLSFPFFHIFCHFLLFSFSSNWHWSSQNSINTLRSWGYRPSPSLSDHYITIYF